MADDMKDNAQGETSNDNSSDNTTDNTQTDNSLQLEFDELTDVKESPVTEGKQDESTDEQIDDDKRQPDDKDKQPEKQPEKETAGKKAKEQPEKQVIDQKDVVSKKEYDELVAKFALLEKQIAKPEEAQKPIINDPKDLQTKEIPIEQAFGELEQTDLHNILSGDVERAKPVLQKFARNMLNMVYQDMQTKAQTHQKITQYANEVYTNFYESNKDLVGNERIVKLVYDDVIKANPNAMPHTLLNKVAEETRMLIAKYSQPVTQETNNNNNGDTGEKPRVRRIVTNKGGEADSVQSPRPSTAKFTDQENEMFELIDNKKMLQ